jgi:hypothetical protein
MRELYGSGGYDSGDNRDSSRSPDRGDHPLTTDAESRRQFAELRADTAYLDNAVSELETESDQHAKEITEVRSELSEHHSEFKSEMAELRAENAELRAELRHAVTALDARVDRLERPQDAPAEPTADNGAMPEREPDWMDRADRPSDLEATRPYDQPQGLTRPEPQHQRDLDGEVLREPDGRAERFPDPRNDWLPLVNDGGRQADPLRGNNCLDCSLSLISTWHGEPRVSAPRFPDRTSDGLLDEESGERHGPERAQLWLGHQYEYLGSAMEGFRAIEEKLRAGGHGASASIINRWKVRGAHAWNAVNYRGEILWIDSQVRAVDKEPVHPSELIDRIWAIVIDRKGAPL